MTGRKEKGSITIFGVLSIVLVAECLLVLIEGARFWTIEKSAGLQSELAMEAVFAGYCSLLWEEYHLLGCEESEMESVLEEYVNGRMSENEWRENLLNYGISGLKIESYTLITDGQGQAYQNAVSDYMRDNILYEAAKLIYGQYEAISSIMGSDTSDMEDVDEALKYLEEGHTEAGGRSVRGGSVSGLEEFTEAEEIAEMTETGETETNPLEEVKKLQKMGILELLIENPQELSTNSFDKSGAVSERTLATGKNAELKESGWMDRVLLQQYLLSYLSAYENEKENRALSYEIEYLIGGKESDVENLKRVAEWMLLIRQAANMLYIMSDSVKVQEAASLAAVLAGATANPIIIEVVKAALLTAWAFGESVLDVRGLLQGKRIPLLKSSELWTLQLSGIGELAEGSVTAKESEIGLSYMDYLGILLLFCSDSTVAMRAMDMQEQTIRKSTGNENFAMDTLLIQAEAAIAYEYEPVFQLFDTLSDGMDWNREIKKISYYRY